LLRPASPPGPQPSISYFTNLCDVSRAVSDHPNNILAVLADLAVIHLTGYYALRGFCYTPAFLATLRSALGSRATLHSELTTQSVDVAFSR
jgi:hypothetical protein